MIMMEESKNRLLFIVRELLWWLIAATGACTVLMPLFLHLHYPYARINGLLWFVAILYFQYVIFFRQSTLLKPKWVRFLIVVVNLNFFIYVLRQYQFFRSMYDSFTPADLGAARHDITYTQLEFLYRYFRIETTLAAVACLLLSMAFNGRILMNYWRTAKTRLNSGDTT